MSNYALQINGVSKRFDSLQQQLATHPLYGAIQNQKQLQVFMEHHVFAVWDFMSLIKSTQNAIAPTTVPWTPSTNPKYVQFINQLVLEEESDHAVTNNDHNNPRSHFEVYIEAMTEIGANIYMISRFINTVRDKGLLAAFAIPKLPSAAKKFMQFTFDVIERQQPHLTVAVLALTREDLVPQLFRALQQNLSTQKNKPSNLMAYLDRHIQLDEQAHAPMAKELLQELCANSHAKQKESIEIAEQALAVRLEFWDNIYQLVRH